ncbi:DUF1343 domain-containing protein [uncultured Muriicola sp.]|uniref:exo-beta-N-acetylmuramidase NamZ family protein n=1 Tax=uncultured Muriicola sp. TaxID=1583102 RepID=UPI002611648B|nr:DUF1343 domain-containing protein [uncultured Muriicola sp.]
MAKDTAINNMQIIVGANRTMEYLPLLRDKKIAVVANQTSVIFKDDSGIRDGQPAYTHLVDSLISLNISVLRVFSPEHGFRGMADAGEKVEDGIDLQTGLPIISLYGAHRKPTKEDLEGIEMIVFDIQDVGVRFYTYIATLQLVMEACAENNIPIMVLDRPNPNGHYIDGPTMEVELTSFLGMTPIPLVYAMSIGEYAQMINEEGWLEKEAKAQLTVISLENYTHNSTYSLPIRPSPNLPNDQSINLYPSLGLFEGTNINAGRGTEFQFQRYGAPFLDKAEFSFTYIPEPNIGAKSPKHMGTICFGEDLSKRPRLSKVSLEWIIKAYQHCLEKSKFFNTSGFSKHAGTELLQKQIEAGMNEAEIRAIWQADLQNFAKIRAKYLLYP